MNKTNYHQNGYHRQRVKCKVCSVQAVTFSCRYEVSPKQNDSGLLSGQESRQLNLPSYYYDRTKCQSIPSDDELFIGRKAAEQYETFTCSTGVTSEKQTSVGVNLSITSSPSPDTMLLLRRVVGLCLLVDYVRLRRVGRI